MHLGQGIEDMVDAVRDRIEVAGHGPTWRVTAGSFDSALAYARERFGDPLVLARTDRARWWPRVTLTVTTDRTMAASAPSLEDMARPAVPAQRRRHARPATHKRTRDTDQLPSSLEAIFAYQEQQRMAGTRSPR